MKNRYKYGIEKVALRAMNTRPNSRKQDPKNLKIKRKSNREFIKAIKSEKTSVAIKDVRTCLVSENIPFLPQPYKMHPFEDDSKKNETNIIETNESSKMIEEKEKIFSRAPTPSQRASEELKILKDCRENILSSEDVLSATLEDSMSQLLPQRDDESNLHGMPISYHIAKVRFYFFRTVTSSLIDQQFTFNTVSKDLFRSKVVIWSTFCILAPFCICISF